MSENRWPNYCPYCGTKSPATRHIAFVCSGCSAHFSVDFYGAYPEAKNTHCDSQFEEHGGKLA